MKQNNYTSIGICQVKVSTAKLLENEEKNIIYVAAYLRYQSDIWKSDYPNIENDAAILGTLYNLGHEKRGSGILGYVFGIGNEPRVPNKNPKANEFGNDVEKYMEQMKRLLEEEKCIE